MKSKSIKFLFTILCLVILIILLIKGFHTSLEISFYTYTDSSLPESFNHYKIVQLSDFHGASFGKNEQLLLDKIKECEPNIIFLTGDMIDENHKPWDNLYYLLDGITSIAPTYAISGNHEFDSWSDFQKLLAVYEHYGVTFIDDELVTITNASNDTIEIQGVKFRWNQSVSDFPHASSNSFSILLNHSSQDFVYTSRLGYNVVFSGHTHGGIIRLPLVGGVFGNNGDKLFPTYASGIFTENGTTMYSSRGLGESFIPRFNNNPEIICVELLHEQ